MNKQDKALAFVALDNFANSRVALIRDMRAAGYRTVEDARPIVIEWACAKTGATFNVSTAGKVMLDSKHARYEAAKTTARDIMAMLEGTTRREKAARNAKRREKAARNAKTEPVKVPAHILKLAKALADAAGDKSLASTALALAFAK